MVHTVVVTSADEVHAVLDRLEYKKQHTSECREKNKLERWQQLTDSRKRCACPYWSCGVHDRAEGFKRKSTGEISLERAKAIVKLRLETGNRTAPLPDQGTPIKDAITDYLDYTKDGGARASTMAKYKTLMDQLQAFADWKGLRYVQELRQDAVMEFRRAWEDAEAGYKQGIPGKNGKRLWRANSTATCKRNAKTLHYFFQRCISRKWITEDPTSILRFPKSATSKTKDEVKYLTPDQLADILAECDAFERMTDYNKQRVKALILTMRWTGLRISDAVVLKADSISGDVLRVRTKKASTDVQIPLHPDLVAALGKLEAYDGGYLFWNRRTDGAKASTPQHNFGALLAQVFTNAGVSTDVHHVSHMLRNTFAVHLLEKGLPLETVSLMLGHQSVTTTERYYADYSKNYMDRAESNVRKVWALSDGETLS
jgi:site-specific recombinase XerD